MGIKGGKLILRDNSRLLWLEEQNGSEKTDLHESGGNEMGRKDLGQKWAGLKGGTEASRLKGPKMKQSILEGQDNVLACGSYSRKANFLFGGAKP